MKAAVTTGCKGKNAWIAWIIPKCPKITRFDGGKGYLTGKKDDF
jgi:hypothetical protein